MGLNAFKAPPKKLGKRKRASPGHDTTAKRGRQGMGSTAAQAEQAAAEALQLTALAELANAQVEHLVRSPEHAARSEGPSRASGGGGEARLAQG